MDTQSIDLQIIPEAALLLAFMRRDALRSVQERHLDSNRRVECSGGIQTSECQQDSVAYLQQSLADYPSDTCKYAC